ncbi:MULTISPECIES: hypothetical protein [unclassified Kribbella]|uniref:hypothetical protein n=1 Tax=unclassified Kribbella TaxID=2644121 RepID=UPI00301A0C32
MNEYEFHIVQLGYRRFLWTFVERGNGKLRILARSHKDYRSKEKVYDAIAKLKPVVNGAKVVDATSFSLPATEFEIHRDSTLPLLVGGRRESLSESTGT